MTPQNEVRPMDESSHQDQPNAANTVTFSAAEGTHSSHDRHQEDKQVVGRKRQAGEMAADDQISQMGMSNQDVATADFANASSASANVRPSKAWQHMLEVAAPSPQKQDLITSSSLTTAEVQELRKIVKEQAARSPSGRAAIWITPDMSESRNHQQDLKELIQGAKDDESRVLKFGWMFGIFRDDKHTNWQELLDMMELNKSRFLEDESALDFLRSLEPSITDGYREHTKTHNRLYLNLARMADDPQSRAMFRMYCTEAPREWYCLRAVCRHGYKDEKALASERKCGCSGTRTMCLQVRIRGDKWGAFDVQHTGR